MNGFPIVTQHRRTPPRTQPTARRASTSTPKGAAQRKPAVRKKPPARGRGPAAAPYRPRWWLLAVVAIVFALLAIAFLVTIAILWSLAGPVTTTGMVLAYSAVMYALWRIAASRL